MSKKIQQNIQTKYKFSTELIEFLGHAQLL